MKKQIKQHCEVWTENNMQIFQSRKLLIDACFSTYWWKRFRQQNNYDFLPWVKFDTSELSEKRNKKDMLEICRELYYHMGDNE